MRAHLAALLCLLTGFACSSSPASCEAPCASPEPVAGSCPACADDAAPFVSALPMVPWLSTSSRMDRRAKNMVAFGNSLTLGTGVGPDGSTGVAPWPLSVNQQLTAGGVTNTIVNAGHGGLSINDLLSHVAADIDANFDATHAKTNILIIQEVTNSLRQRRTAQQAYDDWTALLATVANKWDSVFEITPTPQTYTGGYDVAGINRSGTSPPAVTIGATPGTGSIVCVNVTTGGNLAAMRYSYTLNGVVQATNQTYTVPVNLGGTTFTMPAGTYTNDNIFCATAGFEAHRQAYLALLTADFSHGGYCTRAPLRLDSFPQFETINAKYYQTDQIHWSYLLYAICASEVINVIRGFTPAIAHSPAFEPYPNPYVAAYAPGALLDFGGSPCTNGAAIETIVPVYSVETGNMQKVTTPTRPICATAAVGGKTAVWGDGTQRMRSVNSIWMSETFTVYGVIIFTGGGHFMMGATGANIDVRASAKSGGLTNADEIIRIYNPGPNTGTIDGSSTSMVDSTKHFFCWRSDGTSTSRVQIDTTYLTLTHLAGYSQTPVATLENEVLSLFGTSGSAACKFSDWGYSPVVYTDAAVERIRQSIGL